MAKKACHADIFSHAVKVVVEAVTATALVTATRSPNWVNAQVMPVFSAVLCAGNLGLVGVTVHCHKVGGHAVKVDVGAFNTAATVTLDNLTQLGEVAGHAGIFGQAVKVVVEAATALVTATNSCTCMKWQVMPVFCARQPHACA
ncbi:hypothetical protein [Corynebacterium stationis]|uniref:Uncharacterized protein n=1 Tax=Corynebacterium stationis TaxID=1705 RepID=A0AB36CNQ4_9CORY|nr:hypothetical protein [Corynebacterium stationis]NME90506.1 hypothetical protein [Corynebacterium stationis]